MKKVFFIMNSIPQPDTQQAEFQAFDIEQVYRHVDTEALPQLIVESAPKVIVWTPRFIVAFALTVAIGLSATSMLTIGWSSRLYRAEWVLLAEDTLVFVGWAALLFFSRSPWLRFGAIFGCIWSIFTGLSFFPTLFPADLRVAAVTQLDAAMNSALLGSYLCFSTYRVQFRRLDAWFFSLTPITGAAIVIFERLTHLTHAHFFGLGLERDIAATVLVFCVLIWWLRPSCWISRPGPTFFYGLAPLFTLVLALPSVADVQTNFFFLQLAFLCMLLGIMRMTQEERQRLKG